MTTLRRTTPRRKIATRLRKRRLAAGISQGKVARALDIERGVWQRIETGMQSIPAERIVDICAICDISVDELLGITAVA